jgi:hypothetical protein
MFVLKVDVTISTIEEEDTHVTGFHVIEFHNFSSRRVTEKPVVYLVGGLNLAGFGWHYPLD